MSSAHLAWCDKFHWRTVRHDNVRDALVEMHQDAGEMVRVEWREALPAARRVNRSTGRRALLTESLTRVIPDYVLMSRKGRTHVDVVVSMTLASRGHKAPLDGVHKADKRKHDKYGQQKEDHITDPVMPNEWPRTTIMAAACDPYGGATPATISLFSSAANVYVSLVTEAELLTRSRAAFRGAHLRRISSILQEGTANMIMNIPLGIKARTRRPFKDNKESGTVGSMMGTGITEGTEQHGRQTRLVRQVRQKEVPSMAPERRGRSGCKAQCRKEASSLELVSETAITGWWNYDRHTETKAINFKNQETKKEKFNKKQCPSASGAKKKTIRRASTITAAMLSRSSKAASRGLGKVAQAIVDLKTKRSGHLACSVCGSFVCSC